MNKTEIKNFQQDLLEWYNIHKKPLPWRKTTAAYSVWISEIMSQQTQVETVMPYYLRFIEKYPSIEALAEADDDELLKLWEGLGYYSRARNLKIAAQQVVTNFHGTFPESLEEIKSLQGIGPYTAAAIASISFGLPEPAIDGNLMRVTSRLFEIDADISKASSRKIFDQQLRELISQEHPGDFNQALMDIGSTVCTPKIAKCDICPLAEYCQARLEGTQLKYPVKSKKIKQQHLYYTAYALKNSRGEYYLERRPSTGLLANMWTFPMQEMSKEEFESEVLPAPSNLPDSISRLRKIGEITHVFSHLKWFVQVIECTPEENFMVKEEKLEDNQLWVKISDLTKVALPTPQVKMFKLFKD
ncbi:A/G-specific adenine glycosylase [Lactococcus garvieae]|jgi:A/G-specific adenine glycosylase|uniref:A/G-specific adenine glycosylase n=1 Tax=Lactococcus garvieae TaxID=1363 RepID=UPI0018D71612|nr:A/G-specific adenine glycosylase [Lactococcus garvieae]QPS71357.1 A/G-specific adenine glycosylase [Lactococcus garvieae]